MTPDRLLRTAIIPACAELESFGIVNSHAAHRFTLAIAMQESGLRNRRQVGAGGVENGPAVSFWQGEKGGGLCSGVITHPATAQAMRAICANFNVLPDPASIWEAIRYQDVVAAAAARLLIHTLPQKLPETPADGWAQYLSAWRPGKPRPETWAGCWAAADGILKAQAVA